MSAALSFLPEPASAPVPCTLPVRRPRHLHAVPEGRPVLRPVLRPLVGPESGPEHEGPATLPAQPALPAGRPSSVSVLLPPAEPERVAVRLTRRGVVVLGMLAATVGAVLVWLATASAPSSAQPPASAPAVVTVHAGDTLWSIAGRTAPGADPRAEVDRLRALNGLDSAGAVTLRPGQQLRTR